MRGRDQKSACKTLEQERYSSRKKEAEIRRDGYNVKMEDETEAASYEFEPKPELAWMHLRYCIIWNTLLCEQYSSQYYA